MTDPLSITTVSAQVLTEGIKFLYDQASELLRRWRERRDGKAAAVEAILHAPEHLVDGELTAAAPDDERLDKLHEELSEARRALLDYAEGEAISPANEERVNADVEALRRVVETIYGHRITLKGEDRPPSGPIVAAEIDVGTVRGEVAALRAGSIRSGVVRGIAKADDVEAGGRAFGIHVERDIGG